MTNKQDILRQHFSALGKKGGKKRWAGKTPEEKSEHMRAVARKRWAVGNSERNT